MLRATEPPNRGRGRAAIAVRCRKSKRPIALVMSDSMAGGAPQKPIFGPAVWGWALATGLALWGFRFALMAWWAALLFWWWPSVFVGAAVGLAAISVARLVARATEAKQRATRPRSRTGRPSN